MSPEFSGTEKMPFPLSVTTEWTTTTLAAYLTQKINDHDRVYQQRWESQERSITEHQSFLLTLINDRHRESVLHSDRNKDSMMDNFTLSFTASEKAVAKAELANEKRFEGVNEFRAQLSDQASRFITRAEFDQAIKGLDEKMNSVHNSTMDKFDSIVANFTTRVDDLRTYKDSSKGKNEGLNLGWVVLSGVFAMIGVIGPLILIILRGIQK